LERAGIPKLRTESRQDDDYRTIETPKSSRIVSLDQLLEFTNTDLDTWDVERHLVNKWEVAAKNDAKELVIEEVFQVKAWLRKKKSKLHAEKIRRFVVEKIKKHAFEYPERLKADPPPEHSRHMMEIGMADVHLGALGWAEEVEEDYDLRLGETAVRFVMPTLLRKAGGFPIDRFLFPIGNDFFHFDSNKGETYSGTRQDVDTRWMKMFRTGIDLMIWAIDLLLEVAPVHVMIVPDNHAPTTTLSLGEVLRAWYHHCDDVTVDNRPKTRKYYAYGVNLLGFGHGKDPKLKKYPALMPVEVPELWAHSKIREYHVAHFHHRAKMDELRELNGVVVRILPSLAARDVWHFDHGYVGNLRCAEGYLWNYETGLSGMTVANLLEMNNEEIRSLQDGDTGFGEEGRPRVA
jgi:hypothetical protein